MKQAVILVGGKQYIATEGETLRVDLLPEGTKELETDALLVIDGDKTTVGAPTVKGVKVARQGDGHWEKEFEPWDENSLGVLKDSFLWQHYRVALEDGEKAVFMRGTFVNDDDDPASADHLLLEEGWITVAPFNARMTDMDEFQRLQGLL